VASPRRSGCRRPRNDLELSLWASCSRVVSNGDDFAVYGGNMLANTVTHAVVGLEPRRVEVEAHIENGIPGFAIVGLADRACQEAKHRVRSGIGSAKLEWPLRRITVNLAPADLRKEGPGFDLPIALAVLGASDQLPPASLAGHAAIGELALDGRLRPVPGTLSAAEGARRNGFARLVCAVESGSEVALAGVRAVPVRHLVEAVEYFRGERDPPPSAPAADGRHERPPPDLADVRGQERARRALEIAAAGGHNLLFSGPPGIGKTMLARRLPGILPELDDDSALEVTRIQSVAGLLPPGSGLLRTPPFRAPHHSASVAAIVGGGSSPRPGEVTLAHRGVLLLDELPEFPRSVIEALRQPLEDGAVAVARVGGRALFPARFQLVGTMNLCPCGGRGDPAATCSCSPMQLDRYRERLSRALLDRFDLVLALPRPRAAELASGPAESSSAIRERVAAARLARLQPSTSLAAAARDLLQRAVERLPLSGRGRTRILRVSATIAALAGADSISPEHVAEALSYRSPSELGAG
jgi:magnesium chelatase family protein